MTRLGMMAAALAGLAACAAQEASATGELDVMAQGKYVVESIGGCNDCHTPMTPQGPDMTKTLHGATLIFGPLAEMPWAPSAPALVGGRFSDEHVVSVLTTGKRPDGSMPLPPMPQFRMTEADARAAALYIKSLPAPAQ